jgi:hypothetical protein
MRSRAGTILVLARRQAFESAISPGLPVAIALGLLLASLAVNAFVASIDSAGFNPTLNGFYDLLARILSGTFGPAFVGLLFAEGPFLFALLAAFVPVALFIAVASVFRFGQEKVAGAIELLCYGPVDGRTYFLACFLRDAFLSLVSILAITAFLALSALVHNLVLGPMFLGLLPVLLLLSLATFAWGILCSTLASDASSALALFIGIQAVFLAVLAGSFSIASAVVRTGAAALAALVQWFSPFYYASLSFGSSLGGKAGGYAAGIGLLLALSALLLAASGIVMARRGVRA